MKHDNWRRRLTVLGCGLAAFSLAACGGGSSGGSDGTSAKEETVVINKDLVAKAEAEGTVTVQYGSSLDAMTAQAAQFNKVYPKIKVSLERNAGAPGGAAMLQEFQAGQKHVDVFGGTDVPTSQALVDAGGILPFKPADADLYPADYLIGPGLYSTSASTIVTGFNTDKVTPQEAASLKDWSGILDAHWKGNLAVTTTAVSSGGTPLYYGWKNEGNEWLTRLSDQKPKLYDGTADGQDALVSGRLSVSFGQLESGMLNLLAKGAPVGFTYSNPTVQFQSNFYGVMANAPHPNAAKLFWAWITSKDACEAEQHEPIYQRCPMKGASEMPDLPTDQPWFSPLEKSWTPSFDDWQKGIPDLQAKFAEVFDTL